MMNTNEKLRRVMTVGMMIILLGMLTACAQQGRCDSCRQSGSVMRVQYTSRTMSLCTACRAERCAVCGWLGIPKGARVCTSCHKKEATGVCSDCGGPAYGDPRLGVNLCGPCAVRRMVGR